MAVSNNQPVERRANLALAFEELFTAIVRLRSRRQSVTDAEAFKAQVRAALQSAMQEGMARGYAPEDVNIAAYAVVAFLDESILNLGSPVFAGWSGQSLQQELSHKHLAGETFFAHVQQLLARRDSAELADVLEVFYLCLLLGYSGRYGLSGAGDLSGMMRTIRDKIVRSRGTGVWLSPQARLPVDAAPAKSGDPWTRRLAFTAICAGVATILVFIACQILLISGSSELLSMAGR